jgi:hypothetical protein
VRSATPESASNNPQPDLIDPPQLGQMPHAGAVAMPRSSAASTNCTATYTIHAAEEHSLPQGTAEYNSLRRQIMRAQAASSPRRWR